MTETDRNALPSLWFDQFSEWVAAHPDSGSKQWCARHWAPCPVFGSNGIGAATELMRVFLDEIKPPGVASAAALNREMDKIGRLCCTLGDERMYKIWGNWPPAAALPP